MHRNYIMLFGSGAKKHNINKKTKTKKVAHKQKTKRKRKGGKTIVPVSRQTGIIIVSFLTKEDALNLVLINKSDPIINDVKQVLEEHKSINYIWFNNVLNVKPHLDELYAYIIQVDELFDHNKVINDFNIEYDDDEDEKDYALMEHYKPDFNHIYYPEKHHHSPLTRFIVYNPNLESIGLKHFNELTVSQILRRSGFSTLLTDPKTRVYQTGETTKRIINNNILTKLITH